MLFAFLLIVPFNERFEEATGFQKDDDQVTLMSTAVATALLLAPSTLHRIQFRRDDKKYIVHAANRYAIGGFAALLVSVTGAVLLVTDFVYGVTTTVVSTAAIALVLVVCWFVLPVMRRLRQRSVSGSG